MKMLNMEILILETIQQMSNGNAVLIKDVLVEVNKKLSPKKTLHFTELNEYIAIFENDLKILSFLNNAQSIQLKGRKSERYIDAKKKEIEIYDNSKESISLSKKNNSLMIYTIIFTLLGIIVSIVIFLMSNNCKN